MVETHRKISGVAPGLCAVYSVTVDYDFSDYAGLAAIAIYYANINADVRRCICAVLADRKSFPDEARRAVAAQNVAGLAAAHNAAHAAVMAAKLPAGVRFAGFELERRFWRSKIESSRRPNT